MFSTIRVNVYDLAEFLKDYAEEIFHDGEGPVLDLINKWNDIVKFTYGYGFFFDGESKKDDYCERYWIPPTAISIKAVRKLFNLNKSDNIIVLPKKLLGSWIYEFNVDYRSSNNSISKRKWRTLGEAKASLYLRYR